MNSKRSYLDQLNAGRQRRSHASLEQLNRSLDTLEQRIGQNSHEPDPADAGMPHARDLAYSERFEVGAPSPARGNYDRRYQSMARDVERVREQETGIAAFGKLAGELKGLREELSQQINSGARREFETTRQDVGRSQAADSRHASGLLGAEFERLSGAIQALAERSDDRSVTMLRLEIEQMKTAFDTLAREETVLSMERRFDELESHLASSGEPPAAQPGLAAIARRLEEISDAVRNLPASLSLPSLEEKVRLLASALEHFIGQQSGRKSETVGLIEERLDEISRAIVASTVEAQSTRLDPEPFERIEARISALAHQIEEVAGERPAEQVVERLDLLAERVDEMAALHAMPQKVLEGLAQQIALVAEKIDKASQGTRPGDMMSGIEQRLDMLSGMLERRQAGGLDGDALMGALDARFAALATDMEGRAAGDKAVGGIEARLDDISMRLDVSAEQLAGIDAGLIRNLESQVAALSAHLARPNVPLPEFEDIGPRLDELERSIAGSRDSVVEAAREAAEAAARSLAGSQVDAEAVSGLARDLKTLENLTRRSDERNGKTFEAIHDTLLKIVDRLASLESETVAAVAGLRPEAASAPRKKALKDAPSIDPDGSLTGDDRALGFEELFADAGLSGVEQSPGQAVSATAFTAPEPEGATGGRVRSMLGGLTRAFAGKKRADDPAPAETAEPASAAAAAPEVTLDAPLDPKFANRPLEPGSGAPDLKAIMKRVRDERGQPMRHSETDAAKSDFIAAARRAAQAAAAEAEVLKRGSDLKGPVKALRIGDLLKSRRKPILMATAAMAVALAGLQLGKAFMSDPFQTAEAQTAPSSEKKPLQVASLGATTVPDVLEETEQEPLAVTPAVRAAEPKPAPMPILPKPEKPVAMTAKSAPTPASDKTASGATVASVAPADALPEAPASPIETAFAPVSETPPLQVPAQAGPEALREAAEAGDAKALFEVAARYADGRGVAADSAEAARWYRKSADLGFAPAQFRIGNFYEKGIGVDRDVAKAKDFYLKAAAQGNASAMHNLAVLFAMGAEGTTDNQAAARWFRAAAELGVKDSQFNLGILSAKGVGIPQNLEESYKWFALVAETGDKDAAAKRDEIAASLRPEQLEKARAATELWKPKPLEQEANAVAIPDSWQESPDETAGVDMKKAVQNIQLILGKNGYEAGNPDGVMGARTKSAIAAFQKDNDLEPTGEINEELVQALLERK